MAYLIDKDDLVREIENIRKHYIERDDFDNGWNFALNKVLSFLDTLEVKEVDIDKLCEFRDNIGFAYPEGVSEYQKHLACYRQGIEDVLKAQKGE